MNRQFNIRRFFLLSACALALWCIAEYRDAYRELTEISPMDVAPVGSWLAYACPRPGDPAGRCVRSEKFAFQDVVYRCYLWTGSEPLHVEGDVKWYEASDVYWSWSPCDREPDPIDA